MAKLTHWLKSLAKKPCIDRVGAENLPPRFQETLSLGVGGESIDFSPDGLNLPQALHELERRLILKALEQSNWVKSRAAQLLQLNRTTLIEKMKKQQIFAPNAALPTKSP